MNLAYVSVLLTIVRSQTVHSLLSREGTSKEYGNLRSDFLPSEVDVTDTKENLGRVLPSNYFIHLIRRSRRFSFPLKPRSQSLDYSFLDAGRKLFHALRKRDIPSLRDFRTTMPSTTPRIIARPMQQNQPAPEVTTTPAVRGTIIPAVWTRISNAPTPGTTSTEEDRFRDTTTTATYKILSTLVPGTWSRTATPPPPPPPPNTPRTTSTTKKTRTISSSTPPDTPGTTSSTRSTTVIANTNIPEAWTRTMTGSTETRTSTSVSPPPPTVMTTDTLDSPSSTIIFDSTVIPGKWSRSTSPPNTEPSVSSSSTTMQQSRSSTAAPGHKVSTNSIPVSNGNSLNSSLGFSASNATTTKAENNTIPTLCGFPVYNDMEKCFQQNYNLDPLSECEYEGGVAIFGTLISLLAVVIIVTNSLLPLTVWKVRDMRTQHNYIKVSLSVADMLLGVLLFVDVLPNMVHLRNLSEYRAVEYVTEDTNSSRAIITGGLWILSSQASILHLMFLTAERFIAIKWSLWHRLRKTSTIIITLAALWAVSLACCFVPVAFKDKFQYQLQPALLVHWTVLAQTVDEASGDRQFGVEGPVYSVFTLILPYAITLILCILTGIVTVIKLRSSRRKLFGSGQGGNHVSGASGNASLPKETGRINLKPEISIFITIIMMIAAFTIALLPFTIVSFIFVAGKLNCFNFSVPYASTFYVYLLNGLVNPIVYTVRDKNFRRSLSGLCCTRSQGRGHGKYSYGSKSTNVSS